jgi:amino acid adenylation domain-containing protein
VRTDASLDGLIATHARRDPGAPAVEDGRVALSYGELLSRADEVAEGLRREGVRPGDVVAAYVERSTTAVVSLLGILRAGAAYVPLDPADPAARHALILENARPRAVLPLEPEGVPGGEMESAPGGERLAYVLYTSGSTGRPKGVEITHANVLTLLSGGSDALPQPDDTVLLVTPLNFDISVLELWGALAAGARLVIAPPGRPDPREVGRLIRERGVTFLSAASGVFSRLVDDALDDLAGVRIAVSSADVLQPEAARRLLAAHPHVRLINGYGPTETTVLCTAHEVFEVGADVPIGLPLPGYTARVAEDGELLIGGPGVARGYRDNPEATAERFVDGWYRTGDRVWEDDDGVLHFVGRLDRQVKIGGVRVEPGEVEHALAAHPDVARAAVTVRTPVAGHPQLAAYATPVEGATLEPEALRAHLAERLPQAYVPWTVIALDVMPLTERGKVDRDALPEPAAGGGEGGPVSEEALRVAGVMRELLGDELPGPDDDFFALGGDSLLAIALVGRLRALGHASLGVGAVFAHRTPRALAAALTDAVGPALPAITPRAGGALAPLTGAQRRTWLFGEMNPGARAYQHVGWVRIDGPLDPAALRAALEALVDRHEALRSSIVVRDGEPFQRVHEQVPIALEELDLRGAGSVALAHAARARARAKVDPSQAPWVRWTLMRLADERWALLCLEHHLAHDGWSFDVIMRELGALYGGATLPPPALHVGDVAAWEAANAEALDAQADYWAEVLDPAPELLRLPYDRPRAARESFEGGTVRYRLEPATARAAAALAEEEGATLFQVCLAAFAVQLARYDGRDDMQLGTGVANRGDPGVASTLGMLVNTIALRFDLSEDPSVREVIRRVRDVVIGGLSHADVPFDRVVDRLAPPRDPSRSPLVQTLFSFHDTPRGGVDWPGLSTRVVHALPDDTAKADLNVIGAPMTDGSVDFVWEHADAFDAASAGRIAAHHARLLGEFAARPDAPALTLPLGEPASAATPPRHDPSASLPAVVATIPGEHVSVAGDPGLTYADLWARAGGLAGALRAAGVASGDRVGMALPRSADAVVAHLAAARAGAVMVALDLDHPEARRREILDAAGARVVIGEDVAPDASAPDPGDLDRAAPGDPVQLNFTSGSTGEPKGVIVTHANILRLVQDCAFADLGPGTVTLHAASPAFDATTLEVWGPLVNGGAIAPLAERPDPDAVAEAVARHGVTTLWLTAGLFHALVDRRPDALAAVDHVLAGGDVVSPAHVERALAALPPGGRFTNGYGPTEGTTFTTTWTLRHGDPVAGPLPIGLPVPGTACHVMNARGRELPDGVEGELWIGGGGVANGYWRDPELTAQRFVAGPSGRCYRTGDRVRRRPSDGALEFRGRADGQVKIRGVRVEPAEIEAVLREHPAVADVVVAATGKATGNGTSAGNGGSAADRRLAAYVVARPGGPAPSPAALRAHVAERLPAAMVPVAWVRMPSLPLTANGKVARERLPAPTQEHYARATNGDGHLAGPHERAVIEAFEAVLEIRPVTAEDDFFALGGHSLLALALCAEVQRRTGVRVAPATIFAAPTPRALAATLGPGTVRGGRWDTMVELRGEGSRPPLFVVTAGDGNLLAFAALTRRLSNEQPVYALQPQGLDGQSSFDRSVPVLAERYLGEVRQRQPHGPYLIAGRCNGATVAAEVASRLRAQGEEIALLAALDSEPPQVGPAEIVPGVRRDRIADMAIGAAWRAGEEAPAGGPALRAWLREEVAPGVTRYLAAAWRRRDDIRAAFPDPLGADAPAFVAWAWTSGVREGLITAALLRPETPGAAPYLLAIHALRADLQAQFPDPRGADAHGLVVWGWTTPEDIDPGLLGPPPDRAARLRLARSRARRRAAAGVRDLPVESALLAAGRGLLTAERYAFGGLPGRDARLRRAVRAAAKEARRAYWAEPWPGHLLHVRSAEHRDNPLMDGWWALARDGVTEVHLDAPHMGMLREPDVSLTAQALEEAIDAAFAVA